MTVIQDTRSDVLRYIRETWEGVDEFQFHHGPSQADVAHNFFGSNFSRALAVLEDLERLGHARRVLSFGLYRWIPNDVPRPPKRTPRPRKKTKKRTTANSPAPVSTRPSVRDRILKYVTDEFNEGAAGNRLTLPSTRDVARACISGGSGSAGSCRQALRHLNRLVWSGDLIQVRDEEEDPSFSFNRVYWALPNSGLMAEDNDEPEVEAGPLNKYGFTDERWAAMKPWQRSAIRDIEQAETAPTSWA